MVFGISSEIEEKKPDRPPAKTTNAIYPILNKYSEKTASVKELTTSKISVHKENTISKETSTQSTVTHTNKSETEKLIHNETVNDGTLEQVKKPPVPLKKSPTPASGVGGLFSGLKNKMLPSTDKEKSSSNTVSSSGSSSGGEWDRPDGGAGSKPATNTFDHVERNSILNDPRAGRVKAPRRRPPSQIMREDSMTQPVGLSNGHEAEKPPEKAERTDRPEKAERAEEIKPRTREWEKHKAPWMEELKLNQAKKTSFIADGKSRSVSVSSTSEAGSITSKAGGGSTDRILDCGLEEKRSTHSMEMSKSTSSISSRMSILESFEETTKVRHSLDSKKDATPAPRDFDSQPAVKPVQSPTAAGRTILSMLDDIKKPQAPPPPIATATATTNTPTDKSPNTKVEKPILPNINSDKSPNAKPDKSLPNMDKPAEINSVKVSSSIFEKTSTLERIEKSEEKVPMNSINMESSGTLERRLNVMSEKCESNDALIAQLNSRISNLEKLIEVQNSVFNSALEELRTKLKQETEARAALQAELSKLAHCVTQV